MSLKSALETAKEILEQATLKNVTMIEEGMHDKKNGETEAPGLKGGAMSADGVSPEANQANRLQRTTMLMRLAKRLQKCR